MRILPLVLVALLLTFPSAALAAAPVNDDFADAIDLGTLEEEFFQGSNVAATKEVGEPNHAANAGGKSVWFTWTAPGDNSIPHVAVITSGSFDTILGVYTGASVDALTEVASNDDATFGGGSSVSFATTAGTTYRIAVDGFGGKSGVFFLAALPSPANDNFADAIQLAGGAGTRAGDTLDGATMELGEPLLDLGGSIWYSWQPPADGTYKLSTFGSDNVDTVLAVYEGTSVESLTQLAINDDDPDRGCCSSWIPLVDAEAATTYRIQVMPLGGDGGSNDITISWGPLILGTSGADLLTGTAAADEIRARGGNDVVRGGGGEDSIFGGRGNDELAGQGEADLIFDHSGLDILLGGSGPDSLNARDRRGGDVLRGGADGDLCAADRGDRRRGCP